MDSKRLGVTFRESGEKDITYGNQIRQSGNGI